MISGDPDARLKQIAGEQVAQLRAAARALRDPKAENDAVHKIADQLDGEASGLETRLPKLQEECSKLVQEAFKARFAEHVEEIDKEVAGREREFRDILRTHRWYIGRIARRVAIDGRRSDVSLPISLHDTDFAIERGFQLSGRSGFLTNLTNKPRRHSSDLGNVVARSSLAANAKLTSESMTLARRLSIKYFVRYWIHFADRFLKEALVSFFLLVLVVGYLVELYHAPVVGWGASVLALAYVADKAWNAYSRKQRLAEHRDAVVGAILDLYGDYLVFMRARAIAHIAAEKWVE
jgi:hypothetical protein